LSVVVEHGNAGAATAGPVARDIMTDALTIDPVGRREPPQRVAESITPGAPGRDGSR
jgi:penicillin-binding protein 2